MPKSLDSKKRAYHSPRRQEQAAATRGRIVAAAMRQLEEKGYADMTLESIAHEAGVALQTVYAVCKSKKGVLARILEDSVESHNFDKYRDSIPQLKSGPDRVRAIGHFHSLLLEHTAPGFQIARGLDVVAPELGEMEKDRELMLYEKCRGLILQLAEDGLLRPDVDLESATDVYFALGAPGVHRRLTRLRGWSNRRYAALFSDMLRLMLLKPGAAEGFDPEWPRTEDETSLRD
ncbi:MAG: TetR/AcrR family transcriptional regulator [Desulfovibrionaceae bacterium]|nr:TetR/AcrR family transcriptional regulator [Desulfovibrionaceae bacterium]